MWIVVTFRANIASESDLSLPDLTYEFTVFADTGLFADAVTFGVIIVSESDLSLPD